MSCEFTSNQNLDQLAAAAKAGDSSAMNRLFAAALPRAVLVVGSRLRNHHDAEDAVQAAFLGLVSTRAVERHYDPERPFWPWLARVLQNAAYHVGCRAQARALQSLGDQDVEFADRAPSVLEALSEASVARPEDVLDGLEANLTPALQGGFRAERRGLTHTEYAAQSGLTLDAARSRMYRAKLAAGWDGTEAAA